MVDDRFYGLALPRIRPQNGSQIRSRKHAAGSRPSLSDPLPGRGIGSIRRECLDHVVVFGERHLRHVLLSYMNYYNETRTHLSLDKDAPVSRTVQRAGRILRLPILGGPIYSDLICDRLSLSET